MMAVLSSETLFLIKKIPLVLDKPGVLGLIFLTRRLNEN